MKNSTGTSKNKGFSDDERAAMQERAKELLREAKQNKSREAGEKDLLSKIAEMPEPHRSIAKRVHEIVKANAPLLMPKTWYGMPAYANKEGKIVCFFQSAHKFKYRYSTLGFQDSANLDEGNMWATSYALMKLTAKEEAEIARLVKKAVK